MSLEGDFCCWESTVTMLGIVVGGMLLALQALQKYTSRQLRMLFVIHAWDKVDDQVVSWLLPSLKSQQLMCRHLNSDSVLGHIMSVFCKSIVYRFLDCSEVTVRCIAFFPFTICAAHKLQWGSSEWGTWKGKAVQEFLFQCTSGVETGGM